MKYCKDFEAVINNGTDLDMSQICNCTYKTMNECENSCLKYHDCYNIAKANDILKDYEDFCYENKTWKGILEEYVPDDKVSVATKEENGICVMSEFDDDKKIHNIVIGKTWLEVLDKSGYLDGIRSYVLEMADEDEFWADECYFNHEQKQLIWEFITNSGEKTHCFKGRRLGAAKGKITIPDEFDEWDKEIASKSSENCKSTVIDDGTEYVVTFSVDGYVQVSVQAKSFKDAFKKANNRMTELEFGIKDAEWSPMYAEKDDEQINYEDLDEND